MGRGTTREQQGYKSQVDHVQCMPVYNNSIPIGAENEYRTEGTFCWCTFSYELYLFTYFNIRTAQDSDVEPIVPG